MLLSRGASIVKTANLLTRAKNLSKNVQLVRHGHGDEWCYRSAPTPRKHGVIMAEIVGGLMWWVILWHFWHEYHHFVPEHPYPEPEKWTDEELGIPPEN